MCWLCFVIFISGTEEKQYEESRMIIHNIALALPIGQYYITLLPTSYTTVQKVKMHRT